MEEIYLSPLPYPSLNIGSRDAEFFLFCSLLYPQFLEVSTTCDFLVEWEWASTPQCCNGQSDLEAVRFTTITKTQVSSFSSFSSHWRREACVRELISRATGSKGTVIRTLMTSPWKGHSGTAPRPPAWGGVAASRAESLQPAYGRQSAQSLIAHLLLQILYSRPLNHFPTTLK